MLPRRAAKTGAWPACSAATSNPEPTLYRHARHSYLLYEIKRVGPGWQVLLGATIAYWLGRELVQSVQGLAIASIVRDLDLTAGQISLVSMAALVATLLCALPAGALAVRFDTRPVVSAGLALMALGELGTALAGDWPGFAIGKIVSGGASALVIVPALALNARAAAPRHAALATGLVLAVTGFATVRVRELVLNVLALESWVGWRGVALGTCLVLVLAAVVCWPLLRNPERQPDSPDEPTPSLAALLRATGRQRTVLLFAVAALLSGLATGMFVQLMVMQISGQPGLSPGDTAENVNAARAAGLVGPILAGLAADRIGPRPVLLVLVVLQVLAFALLGFGGNLVVLSLMAALQSFAALGIMTVVVATAGMVSGRRLAPVAVGLVVLALSAGQGVGFALLSAAGGSVGPAGGVAWWPIVLALAVTVLALLVVLASPRAPANAPDSP